MRIRDFKIEDADKLVEILKLNGQYDPIIEGPEAMKRVSECEAAVYLVAEKEREVVGVIKGIYDGSRALIHQISVHPDHQKRRIGSALLRETAHRFKEMRATSVAVTASTRSKGFFEKLGFKEHRYAVFMFADPIDKVIEK